MINMIFVLRSLKGRCYAITILERVDENWHTGRAYSHLFALEFDMKESQVRNADRCAHYDQ